MNWQDHHTSDDIKIKLRKIKGTYSQRKITKTRYLRNVRATATADERATIAAAFARLMCLSDEAYQEDPEYIKNYELVRSNETT